MFVLNRKARRFLALSAAVEMVIAGMSPRTFAAENDFINGGSSTSWNDALNWSSGATPISTDSVLFDPTLYGTAIPNNTLDANFTIATLGFKGTGGYSIDAGANQQTLTLNGGANAVGGTDLISLDSSATGTVSFGATAGTGLLTLALGTSGNFSVNSSTATLNFTSNTVISGAQNLSFSGTGTLILSGANTFGGNSNSFTLTSGTLDINNASALGDASNTFVINGGAIDNTSGAAITTASYVQTWGGDFAFIGTKDLNLGAGAVTLTGTRTVTVTGGNLTVGGIIGDGGGGFGLTKAGAGTLILGGVNTFTGAVQVNAGTLEATVNNALDTASSLTVNSGGTLAYSLAANGNAGVSIQLAGGTLSNLAGNQFGLASGKAVNVTAASTINVAAAFPGKILLGTGQLTGSGNLTKTGSGDLQMAGAQTGYTGNWTVSGGTLELQNPSAAGAAGATITVNTGGEAVTSGQTIPQKITLAGGTLSGNGTTAGTNVFSGPISVTANSSIALREFQSTGTGTTLTLSGALSGTGNLTVTAPAAETFTLSGNNSAYSGKISLGGNVTTTMLSAANFGTGGFTLAGGKLVNNAANFTSPTLGSAGVNVWYYSLGTNPDARTNPSNYAVDLLYQQARVIAGGAVSTISIPNGGSGTYPVPAPAGYSVNTNDGAMWKGLLNITNAGSYQFSGIDDDDAILFIDGQQIGALNVNSAPANIGSAVTLSAGPHSIVYKFSQGGGGGYSVLSYSGPDTSSSPVVVGSIAGSLTNGSLAATDVGPMSVTANSTFDFGVDSSSSTLSISGGTFTLTSNTISTYTVTGATTLSGNATLAPTTGALVLNGQVTGNAGTGNGLTIAGPYLTVFNDTNINATNNYTGKTTVTGGQLQLNATGGGAIPGDLLVNAANSNGFTTNVLLEQANQIASGSNVTIQNGFLDLNSFNDTIASLTLNGGWVLNSGGAGTLNITGSLSLQSGEADANIAGTFSGGVSKTTTGTVILTGNNTFTGAVNVSAGVVNAIGPNSLGAGGAGNDVTVASGAQLQLAGVLDGTKNVSISGTGIIGDGALRNFAGTSIINNLTLAADSILSVDSGELVINGALNTSGGALTKTGNGALTFASNQASLPAVTLTAGALGFSGPQSFGSATVPAGLAFQFDSDPGAGVSVTDPAGSAVIGNFAVDQTFLSRINSSSTGALLLAANDGNALSFSSTNLALGALGLVKYSGTITPNAAGFNFGSIAGQGFGPNELTVTSNLSGTSALAVSGGTVSLPSANTFTGNATVSGGTLRLVNNSALGNVANTITLNGGTLQLITSSNNVAGSVFGQLGNVIGGSNAGRNIVIGPNGGTIDVSSSNAGGNLYALTGVVSGSGTLTKTGLGFLAITNADTFSGNLVIATNGNQFDVRAGGSLPNVLSITVNTGGQFNVDQQNGLGQGRETSFAGVYNANRVNVAAPITLQGGSFLFTPHGASGQISETFGALSLALGQDAITANSNPSGSVGAIITFADLDVFADNVNGFGTVRFGGNAGTFGAGSSGAPGVNNTQVLFTNMGGSPATNQALLPYASIYGTDLAQYTTATGVKIASYTNFATAGTITPAAGNIVNLTAAGTYTLAGSVTDISALRYGSGNNANVLAFSVGTQTLTIDGGAVIADSNNQNRDIGTSTTRGVLTSGTSTLYLHNTNGNLRVFSTITDGTAGAMAVVKDLDGTVTLDAPSNTYSGGTYVLRGTLTADNTGSLGTGAVVVKNSFLNLGNKGATSSLNGYTTIDQAEIFLTNGNATAAGAYNAQGDLFNIASGSTIYANSPGTGFGLNSLTRVTSYSATGGQVILAPGAIVRQNLVNGIEGVGNLVPQNLGTNADLFFSPGSGGGQDQRITVGTGTPWMGLSTDRNSSSWNNGLIYANSDFYLQGLMRDGAYAVLTLGSVNTTGSYGIVNNAGKPINAYVEGQVALSEDTPVTLPSNLTFVVTPGALFQPNASMSLGSNGSYASILVQAGGTLDPGPYVPVGAGANMPQNVQYPLPSPVNGNVTVEAGGRFLLNDASGIGSVGNGSVYTFNTDGILEFATANAFFGSTNGLISPGQFAFQPGAIVRLDTDNIYRLDQFVNAATGGQQVVFELAGGDRTLTNQSNPFTVVSFGTPNIEPESLTLSNGGMLTNDSNDRNARAGRGSITLANGAILAGTNQTYFNIQANLIIPAGANVTIGSASILDGAQKLGAVQLTGPESNQIDPSAIVTVADGAQLAFNQPNVWTDSAGLVLSTAVTNFTPPGAYPAQPGNGASLLLNTTNFTEVIGPLTGNGAVMANTTSTALATGWGASSDFVSNVVFAGANGQNPGLNKIGPTNMTLTGLSTSNASMIAEQGTLTIGQAGQTVFGQDGTLRGATLALDDATAMLAGAGTTPTSAVRLGGTIAAPIGSVAPGGGTFAVTGGTTDVTEAVVNLYNSVRSANNLSLTGDYSYLNLNPGAGALTLFAVNLENSTSGGVGGQRNGIWVVRSASVGNVPGTYAVTGVYTPAAGVSNGLLVAQFPNMFQQSAIVTTAGGVIGFAAGSPVVPTRPDYLGDTNLTGQGVGFMTEDSILLPATEASGSATLTVPNTTNLTVGMVVSGPNIPTGTTIAAIPTGTTITLSANATAAATNQPIGFIPAGTGLRLLAPSEYAPLIENNVSISVNTKLSGSVSINGDSRVQTLTLTPGTTLSINGTLPLNSTPSRLVLSAPAVLTQPGTASTINGDTNVFLQAPGGNSLYFHTFGDLNLNTPVFTDTDIVKTNAGTLNVGAGDFTAFRGSLTVEGGTVNLAANNSFYVTRDTGQLAGTTNHNGFSGVNLYLDSGTLNLNGNSEFIGALVSSNPLPGMGGTLTSATPATVTVQNGGSFSGSISGAISLDKVSNNTLLLTNANPYTGATIIRQGTLALRDQATLANTSGIDLRYATLQLDNSYLGEIDNRIPTSIPVNSYGGVVQLIGASGQVASQTIATLNLDAGRTDINSNAGGGGANVLTIGNLVRQPGTIITFNQTYGFLGTAGNNTTAIRDFVNNINGSPVTLTNGIIGGWAVANGDHFASYLPTTGISYSGNTADGYPAEAGSVVTATATQNVSDGSTAQTLTASKTINSYRLVPGGTTTITFNDTVGLTLNTGGLITNANQTINFVPAASSSGQFLTSNTDELDLWINQGTTNINIPITGFSNDLIKSGSATLGLGAANSYHGTTYVNSGTLNLNLAGADATANATIQGNLVINNATVNETLANNIESTSNIILTGGGRLNLAPVAGISETLSSITMSDAAGTGSNSLDGLDRTTNEPTSSVTLTAATPITVTNTNPTTTPFIGAFIGTLNFTNATGATLSITAPTTTNGLAAIGLVMAGNIGNVPTGVTGGGLIKTGNGILALNPGTANLFGSPTSLTDVFNIQQGIVRVDAVGALGSNFANTNVQSGAGILGNSNSTGVTGSITLKDGSFLGVTLNSTVFGAATATATSQSIINVPSGTVTMYVDDYLVPATNGGNITINGHLTGAANLSLVGAQITGTTGTLSLGNPIVTGAGSNDYSGTITVNVNTILQSQQALLSPATSITGDELGTASIILNGGRLRLRDDFSTTNANEANQVLEYANNVTLAANSASFIDANRVSSNASTKNNIIDLALLTLPAGTETLTVDSGNGYVVGFDSIDGAGTLVKASGSQLNINAVANTFTGGITIAGPQGLAVQESQGLNFPSATTTIPNLTVNGLYNAAASRTLNVSGTLAIGNNTGTITNGLNGVTTGSTVGTLSLPSGATVAANILNNNGIIGNSVGVGGTTVTQSAGTISATTLTGSGFYEALNQSLTVNGALGDNTGIFKVAGNNTVNFNAAGNGTINGVQVQSGTLHVTGAASGLAPFGSGAINVFGLPAVALGPTATAGASATLQFDTGAANNLLHNGSITNSGTVRAMGTGVTTVSGTISGTPVTFAPGLAEGVILATTSLDTTATRAANPANFGLKLEPRMGQTNLVTENPITGWSDDTTWVYTGQFYDPSPTFSFAKSIDDGTLVSIDGTIRLQSGTYNHVDSSAYKAGQSGASPNLANDNAGTPTINLGMGPNNDGWHTIEIRFENGSGGAGPYAQNDFFANFGFGLDPTGATALDGALYSRPIDPGDGSIFRTPVGGEGTVQVDAGATLAAGGVNLTGLLSIGAAATGGTFITNNTATGDNVDALTVTGTTGAATVTVSNAAGNLTVNGTGKSDGTGSFTPGTTGLFMPAGTTLAKSGPGTLTVLGTGATTATSVIQLSGGTVSFANNALGATGSTLAQINFTGSSTLQWHDTNTQDVSAQIQPLAAGVTATFDTNGNAVAFANPLSEAAASANVTKVGLGSLALNAPAGSTYTGATNINAGLLLANNTTGSATGSGPVNVNNSGALGGTGTIGSSSAPAQLTVNSGGTITAGDGTTVANSTGLLTATGGDASSTYSMVLASGGHYAWKLNAATQTNSTATQVNGVGTTELQTTTTPAGTHWDTLAMNSLSVTATTTSNFIIDLIPQTGSTFNNAGTYTWSIADVTSGNVAIAGVNSGAVQNYSGATGAANLAANLQAHFALNVPASMTPAAGSGYSVSAIPDGASGDDIVLNYAPVPAPEPTSLAMLTLGAAGLMLRRRRRRSSLAGLTGATELSGG